MVSLAYINKLLWYFVSQILHNYMELPFCVKENKNEVYIRFNSELTATSIPDHLFIISAFILCQLDQSITE